MASFTLMFKYDDTQAARIFAALKANAVSELVSVPSEADAIEWFRQEQLARLEALVKVYERTQAEKAAAAAAVVDIF